MRKTRKDKSEMKPGDCVVERWMEPMPILKTKVVVDEEVD
jgi:hypothetical protein